MNKQALAMAYAIRRIAKTGIKPQAPVLSEPEPAVDDLDMLDSGPGELELEPEAEAQPSKVSRVAAIIKRLKA